MTNRKTGIFFTAGIFTACFFFFITGAFAGYRWNEKLFYNKMAAVVSVLPQEQKALARALKDTEKCDLLAGREILHRYGYDGHLPGQGGFLPYLGASLLFSLLGAAAIGLWLGQQDRKLKQRTETLTQYLRQGEEGNYALCFEKGQDGLSHLEDEIYKTVMALRESREGLKRERENLARNLADISHQLKTPLTALSVLVELLRRRVVGEEELALADKMEKQTDRLGNLTAALLTLARADAGALTFDMRNVPVGELLSASLESLLPLMEEKGQQMEIYGEEEVSLCCDLGWTREALGNLMKNASEHAPEGSKIWVRVWENPIYTGIAIEDEGEGFSPKDLRCLFQRFYKGERSGKGGAGIGLSLARSLIESQNGEIRAENRKQGGARFVVKFYKGMGDEGK